ncbi:18520_t:CDS:2 [Funneliformis geosporum]|nr:18520_t:CDS:2 [Funneliformis geosporum]
MNKKQIKLQSLLWVRGVSRPLSSISEAPPVPAKVVPNPPKNGLIADGRFSIHIKIKNNRYSLEQDLRLLINNPKYSDVEILCKYEKNLHGCRAILAARSEVFYRLLFSRVGEKESLTKENIVETFIAADYFQLPELQNFIVKTNSYDNYSPELLSKILETMPLTEDNILSNLLVDAVSAIPLNTIKFGHLSIVRAPNDCNEHQSVRAKVAFENQGTFEWDVIIEKHCVIAWALSVSYKDENGVYYPYFPSFKNDNSKVTVHLDMNKKGPVHLL